MSPFEPRVMATLPSLSCEWLGMKMPMHFSSAARTCGVSWQTCAKFGEPTSSSPSATSTRLTGIFLPAPRIACIAARNAACGPFWLVAARPIMTVPRPGRSTSFASQGGELHSAGSTCLTSYMK